MCWNRLSPFKLDRNSTKTEAKTWSKCSNGGKTIAESILAQVEINKFERTGLSGSHSMIQVGTLIIWVMNFKIITYPTRPIISPRIDYPVVIMNFEVSKYKIWANGLTVIKC